MAGQGKFPATRREIFLNATMLTKYEAGSRRKKIYTPRKIAGDPSFRRARLAIFADRATKGCHDGGGFELRSVWTRYRSKSKQNFRCMYKSFCWYLRNFTFVTVRRFDRSTGETEGTMLFAEILDRGRVLIINGRNYLRFARYSIYTSNVFEEMIYLNGSMVG